MPSSQRGASVAGLTNPIFDALVAAFEPRFPDRGMRLERSAIAPDRTFPDIVFPARHPHVGDLVISDDGDEATVYIGAITHSHFGSYDESLSAERAAERIAADVADFIELLFADRVLLWKAFGAGGWHRVEKPATVSPRSWFRKWFVWSRPL